MIKVKYKLGEDISEENWRLSITYNVDCILVETENFTHGFGSGEDWDKITKFSDRNGGYEMCVTYITKDKSKMDLVIDKLIATLHSIIENNIIIVEKEIKNKVERLKSLNDVLTSAIFRNQKLDSVLSV